MGENMTFNTKYFGKIDLDDSKVITFTNGLFGFEQYKTFALLYDSESGERPTIQWLQSTDEETLALPVMIPTIVMPEYNPIVEEGLLESIGDWNEDTISVLVTLTVPADIKNMTTNMKAPIIINTASMKGCQVVAENTDYQIKYGIYSILEAAKKAKEDN
ncbi:MAG: flagellar assembly protein FliW [Lachnospiraceae bacterium]|nr:flagellar assembly protein FliW [Lachnospiraceae bacterium]